MRDVTTLKYQSEGKRKTKERFDSRVRERNKAKNVKLQSVWLNTFHLLQDTMNIAVPVSNLISHKC